MGVQRGEMYLASSLRVLKGLPRLSGRSGQYSIKVSFGGSGTLKIVIYVENYPQKRRFRLAVYHPYMYIYGKYIYCVR